MEEVEDQAPRSSLSYHSFLVGRQIRDYQWWYYVNLESNSR